MADSLTLDFSSTELCREAHENFVELDVLKTASLPMEKGVLLDLLPRKHVVQAPLVSVIVCNYNYGCFLRSAVESVWSQSYKAIECIVVDDCSNDCSERILSELELEDPSLVVIRKETNGGQSSASLDGLAKAQGEFVLFLDADDILFENCVKQHLALHLSSRIAVGFSCCNAVQLSQDNRVLGRWSSLSASMMRIPQDPSLLSIDAAAHLSQFAIVLPNINPDNVRYVDWKNKAWPWTSTSCMFFRKDALDLVCGAEGLPSLRISTDNYLSHAINHLTGSLLLDETLVGYRLHGSNNFNKRPSLENFFCHNREDENYNLTRRVTRIFQICHLLDHADREPGLPSWAARSRFHRLVVEKRLSWQAFFSRKQILALVLVKCIPNPWRICATRQ